MLLEIVETQGDDIFKNEDTMTRFLQTVVFPLFPAGFVRMPTLIQQSK